MNKVYISLGSNMGDRQFNINKAIKLVDEKVGKVVKVANIIETTAYGYENQADFLNTAICVRTNIEPYELLLILKDIEKEVGRKPTFRWGPRVVDLDIILYGDLVYVTSDLVIPHKDYKNRKFVLEPLIELDFTLVDPVSRERVVDILGKLE